MFFPIALSVDHRFSRQEISGNMTDGALRVAAAKGGYLEGRSGGWVKTLFFFAVV